MSLLLEVRDLQVEGRTPSGGWRKTVEGVSFSLRAGEVLALIGESGAGKSTIGLAALGYRRPGIRLASGSVKLSGQELLGKNLRSLRNLRGPEVAYVAQSSASSLNPAIMIGTQVSEGMLIHRLCNEEAAEARSRELLELLRLPTPGAMMQRYPQQLSGGQQQRVMMAMAMSCSPKLFVLDEPTTALDVTTQLGVLIAMRDAIRSTQSAALYVSHDLAVVAQIADRILVLKDGKMVEEGSTEAVLHAPKDDYSRSLLAAARAQPASVRSAAATDIVPAPTLSIRGLSASYVRNGFGAQPPKESLILDNVSPDLRPGEILALVGESGSGKSTLVRCIAGLHTPLAGEAIYQGQPLPDVVARRSKAQLQAIQTVFQSPEKSLNPQKRIRDILARPLDFYFRLSRGEANARVEQLLRDVGLPVDYADRFPFELSGGQRQRISIARALAAEPSVVLCDEVLSALDTVVAAKVRELLKALRDKHKASFLFVTHDLATVAALADRIAVINKGKIVEIGSTAEVMTNPKDEYTALLLRSVPQLRTDWLDEVISKHKIGAAEVTH